MSNVSETTASWSLESGAETLRRNWGWFFALGTAMVMLGVTALALPGLAGLGVTLMLGWALLIGGTLQGVHVFTARRWRGFFVQLAVAVLYAGVGAAMLANPLIGLYTLTLVFTAFLLVEGVCRVVLALEVRPTPSWGWVALSGGVSIVLASLIWANLPGDVLWVVGLLVGVNISFNGFTTMMVALAARPKWKSTGCGCGCGNHG